MDTKLSKFVFSQLGKRRNLWNLRFNELYLLSANPSGISHINIYSIKKSCIHAISKRIYSTMDAESVHVVFKVVRQCNKTQYDTYTRQNMPIFESVTALRHFLVDNFKAELAPAGHAESFLGYITGTNRRITISSGVQLAEAYSLVKKGWITLWADPDYLFLSLFFM